MVVWRPRRLPDLGPERTAHGILQVLEDLMNEARNILGAGPVYHAAMSRYLKWVSTAEAQLRDSFVDEAVVAALHTSRYWFLIGLDTTAEPWRILHDELLLQLSILEEYADQLRHELYTFQLEEGEQAILLDTNFYLHYRQIDQIQWGKHVPGKRHRIVVPAVVLKELDDKKFHRNSVISRSASRAVRFLYLARGREHPEEPTPLPDRPSVRVQILLDPAGHQTQSSADEEILRRAEHLASVIGRDQLVVGSADYGFHLAAAVRGLSTWWPDEALRRVAPDGK